MNWTEYIEKRFHDPAALMAWMIIVKDPFFWYEAGRIWDRKE